MPLFAWIVPVLTHDEQNETSAICFKRELFVPWPLFCNAGLSCCFQRFLVHQPAMDLGSSLAYRYSLTDMGLCSKEKSPTD
jgi:hypothetical protein